MAKSKSSNTASDSTASKLLAVDSELAAQEAQLAAQIEALQEKRKSLQDVIHMFGSTNGHTSADEALSESVPASSNGSVAAAPAKSIEAPTAPKRRGRKPSSTKDKETPTSHSTTKTTSKSTDAKPAKSSGKKSSATQDDSKKSVDWQPYVRKEYQDRSLPQAVLSVLRDHPNEVVEVPTIIDTIFVDDIPKMARASARDRLSNVLSVGLKNKKWFRGKTGEYSVSKEAAAMSIAS